MLKVLLFKTFVFIFLESGIVSFASVNYIKLELTYFDLKTTLAVPLVLPIWLELSISLSIFDEKIWIYNIESKETKGGVLLAWGKL